LTENIYDIGDFEYLTAEKYEFDGNAGQTLTGYFYSTDHIFGIVVFAPGYGAGQNKYMPVYDFFAQRGYAVFAYDPTGTGESEGDEVGGMPQAIKDLKSAVEFVQTKNTGNYPIVLAGHSAGAYAAGCVLRDFPQIEAAILLAGFNSSTDLMCASTARYIGPLATLQKGFIEAYETHKYGDLAKTTVADSIDNSNAEVLAVFSTADKTVPLSIGYGMWKDNPKVTCILKDGRTHGAIYMQNDTDLDTELLAEATEFINGILEESQAA